MKKASTWLVCLCWFFLVKNGSVYIETSAGDFCNYAVLIAVRLLRDEPCQECNYIKLHSQPYFCSHIFIFIHINVNLIRLTKFVKLNWKNNKKKLKDDDFHTILQILILYKMISQRMWILWGFLSKQYWKMITNGNVNL